MKELETTKMVRKAHIDLTNTLINEIARKEFSSEYTEDTVKTLKEEIRSEQLFEKEDSNFWYKIGFSKGMVYGALATVGSFIIGAVIGTYLDK